jgi:hypothetical protein
MSAGSRSPHPAGPCSSSVRGGKPIPAERCRTCFRTRRCFSPARTSSGPTASSLHEGGARRAAREDAYGWLSMFTDQDGTRNALGQRDMRSSPTPRAPASYAEHAPTLDARPLHRRSSTRAPARKRRPRQCWHRGKRSRAAWPRVRRRAALPSWAVVCRPQGASLSHARFVAKEASGLLPGRDATNNHWLIV